MQKIQIKKVLNKEDFKNAFFENFNITVLKKPLTDKELELLKELYELSITDSFTDITSTEARKLLCKKLNITQPNLSTYLKKLKSLSLLVGDKENFILNKGISIKKDEVHFTTILKLKNG